MPIWPGSANVSRGLEKALFRRHADAQAVELFLYDVTSSYLEGEHNVLGAYGYCRDKKRGKPQIVVGLLTDAQGEPVSVEVFRGNTSDVSTLTAQAGASIWLPARHFGRRPGPDQASGHRGTASEGLLLYQRDHQGADRDPAQAGGD
jgi:hypothetical protein